MDSDAMRSSGPALGAHRTRLLWRRRTSPLLTPPLHMQSTLAAGLLGRPAECVPKRRRLRGRRLYHPFSSDSIAKRRCQVRSSNAVSAILEHTSATCLLACFLHFRQSPSRNVVSNRLPALMSTCVTSTTPHHSQLHAQRGTSRSLPAYG
jgi:hypothetical protein